jgi:NifU-like protein involved in Fe-S cluster formation
MGLFSQTVAYHSTHPHRMGPMPQATHVGQEGMPGEGPYMRILLHMEGERITTAGFETYGCPSCIACGSWITQWTEGRTREEVMKIEARDLMVVLGGVPLGKEHCVRLAVTALHRAVTDNQEL